MNKDIKRRWVKALKSGEYKQGTGQIRINDKFCCLGVLCDLYSKETGVQWRFDTMHREEHYLPYEVLNWAGITDANPYVGADTLGFVNDLGKPFPKIANLINRHL